MMEMRKRRLRGDCHVVVNLTSYPSSPALLVLRILYRTTFLLCLDLSRCGEEGFLFEDHSPLIFRGLRKDGWREVGFPRDVAGWMDERLRRVIDCEGYLTWDLRSRPHMFEFPATQNPRHSCLNDSPAALPLPTLKTCFSLA